MTISPNTSFCPYKGLQPYLEEDRTYFFGRERDREIIASNLYASPLTLLYGASGVGKTSVLRAGVVPQLQQTPRVAVMVFREWQQPDLLPALKDAVLRALGLSPGKPSPRVEPSLSFDEFLRKCALALHGSVFLILDQFEEYFLYHPPSPEGDRFDAELASAINRQDNGANFLLSMREDGLSKLDRFRGRIPNLLTNLLRLKHLDRDAAASAMRGPLEEYNRHLPQDQPPMNIDDDLVEALLEEVRTGKVTLKQTGEGQVGNRANSDSDAGIETPFLQMVLTRLWDEERAASSSSLRLGTLRRLGGAGNIVRTHLDKVMETLSDAERDVSARAFRFLVTPDGGKIALTAPVLANWAEVAGAQLEPVLQKLSEAKTRILRPVSPPPDQPNAWRYEIFHDVLAASILDWRARYVQSQEVANAEKRAAADAAEREKEAARVREVEQANALASEQEQRAETEARTAIKLRRQRRVLVFLALILIVVAIDAWMQTSSAKLHAQVASQKTRLAAEQEARLKSVQTFAADAEARGDLSVSGCGAKGACNPVDALKNYQQAERLDPALISADQWNKVCTFGSRRGFAKDVMYACEQAAKLKPNQIEFIDSRGLAKALAGDTQGAIDDFKAVVAASTGSLHEDRQDWIQALQAGKNPFAAKEFAAYQHMLMLNQAHEMVSAKLSSADNLLQCRNSPGTCQPVAALREYQEAQKVSASAPITADAWNNVCWYGSLKGSAKDVMPACEQAVRLDSNNVSYRDSRGLARALTGNKMGAIEDFKAFADGSTVNDRKSQRQAWIDALQKGQNPFTPDVLKTLFGQ